MNVSTDGCRNRAYDGPKAGLFLKIFLNHWSKKYHNEACSWHNDAENMMD